MAKTRSKVVLTGPNSRIPPPAGVGEGLSSLGTADIVVFTCSGPLSSEAQHNYSSLPLQVLHSLLNQSENTFGWPQVVSEDIVKQVHKLKNEMFVMGGKIKGKTLLPIPEHLERLDGTMDSTER